jgi:hypothetical protein
MKRGEREREREREREQRRRWREMCRLYLVYSIYNNMVTIVSINRKPMSGEQEIID